MSKRSEDGGRKVTTSDHAFGDTSWTLIGDLRSGDPRRREAAMTTLVETYRGPIYAYFRSLGSRPDRAAELTQSFFADKVLHGRLFEKADRKRARLRTLLRTSLRNYNTDRIRGDASGIAGKTLTAGVFAAEERLLPRHAPTDPTDIFQRRWASVVLEEAMHRCRRHYVASGRTRVWEAFYARTVRPILSGAKPPSQAEVAEHAGFATAAEATKAVHEVRTRIMKIHLLEVVSETVTDPESAQEELNELMRVLR